MPVEGLFILLLLHYSAWAITSSRHKYKLSLKVHKLNRKGKIRVIRQLMSDV